MGGAGQRLPRNYMGEWGSLGSPPQVGVTVYGLSSNRQRPFAGALHAAIFNTARRVRFQAPYIIVPMLLGYGAMQWAIDKNEYYNSKAGRQAYGFE